MHGTAKRTTHHAFYLLEGRQNCARLKRDALQVLLCAELNELLSRLGVEVEHCDLGVLGYTDPSDGRLEARSPAQLTHCEHDVTAGERTRCGHFDRYFVWLSGQDRSPLSRGPYK